MRYYIQHGAGLSDLVLAAVADDLSEAQLLFHDDSSMVVDTPSAPDRLASLPYLKNTFQVVSSVPRRQLHASVDHLVRSVRQRRSLADGRRGAPFRTMANVDGKLVSLPSQSRAQLESVIAEQTQGRLNARGGAGTEFWIVGRRDLDVLLLGRRLSPGGKNTGPPGSLSPDLATLLVKASRPERDDVFLDPFAGSGALIAARLASPLRKAIYSDIRVADYRDCLPRKLTVSRHVMLLGEDALSLPSIADGSISTIVTDPPWGEHEKLDVPYEDFARAMLRSFDRVLHPDKGCAVVLLGRRVAADVAPLWEESPLRAWVDYHILVNGHPATVLVGGR